MRPVLRRLRMLLKKRQLERDLQDEIAYHMEQRQAAAHAPFGNTTLVQEEMRSMWTFPRLEDVWRDARHAIRILRRTPAQTAAIIVLLAIGIGANSAIFSLVNSVLLQELPVHDPKGLVVVNRVGGTRRISAFSVPLFERFRDQLTSVDIVAAGPLSNPELKLAANSPDEVPEPSGTLVSGNFFQVLGVQAALGRVFTAEDDRPEDPHAVIVLSHNFWQRVFGGDRGVVGRNVYLFGTPFTILGVMPEDFRGIGRDFFVPLGMQPVAAGGEDVRRMEGRTWLAAVGRLKPGITRAQAESEAGIVFNRVNPPAAGQQPEKIGFDPGNRSFAWIPLEAQFGTPLRILLGAVGMLLLVACANVASILLARAGARQQEIAVRQAIGCSRGRLLRQFLVESLILAGSGGALGLLLAVLGARALVLLAPPGSLDQVYGGLDLNVLLFTFAVSVGAALIFGLAPALRASRIALDPVLRSTPRGSTASRATLWLNRAFVVAQAALSMVLVVGATLFAVNLYKLYSVDPGYAHDRVISASINARNLIAGADSDEFPGLARRLQERIAQVPGVRSVAVSGAGFLSGSARTNAARIEGQQKSAGVRVDQSSQTLLETMGIPILAGRGFTQGDRDGAPGVAIVNQHFARVHFAGQNPIGKHIYFDNGERIVEIVGVAGDSKFADLREVPLPVAFLPIEQWPARFNFIHVRTEGPAETVLPFVARAILDVEPKLRPTRIETIEMSRDRTISRDILMARLSALFGALALLVACFGIYGMISYAVSSRSAEIGIRLALGAQPAGVRRAVIADALKIVVPGLLAGIAGAMALERFIASILFGVTGRDPSTYAAVALGLTLTSVLAAWIPARRASRIDPVSALRCD